MPKIEDAQTIEGAGEAKTKIRIWLSALKHDPDTESALPLKLYRTFKSADTEVAEYKLELGEDIDELTKEIIEDAETDCEELNGRVKYSLKVVNGKPRLGFSLKMPLHEGDVSEDIDGYDGDPPNARGLVHQAQGHTQAMAKIMVQAVKSPLEIMEHTIKTQSRRIEYLESKQAELILQKEQLISMDWARKMEVDRIEKQDEMKRQGMKMLFSAGNQLMMHLTGKPLQLPGGPGGPAPAVTEEAPPEVLIEKFFTSLTEEQQQVLVQTLKQDQMQMLFNLKQAIEKKKSANQSSANGQGQSNGTNGRANGSSFSNHPPYNPYNPSSS